jgi:hypothetical protein
VRSNLQSVTNYGHRIAYIECSEEDQIMLVVGGLGILVVFCLFLSMLQTPPAIGR